MAENEPIHVPAFMGRRPKVTSNVTLIRRCKVCWERDGVITPNPDRLPQCPVCGSDMPIEQNIPVLKNAAFLNKFFPWHARVLFAIGDGLRWLARKIEGKPK